MEASTGAPPQRVCPKCARISWATGPQCPYCTARFRRRGGIAPWMLVVATLVVLVAMAVMLAVGGRIAENRFDDRVEEVQKDFDASLKRFGDEVRRELDARAVATPPPAATPTPTPVPTTTPEGDETPTPSATPTSTPTDELPTPEPDEIRP